MKKFIAVMIALVLILSVAALAEAVEWGEKPVGEAYVVMLPAEMADAVEPSATVWDDMTDKVYSGRCDDLAVEIAQFTDALSLEDVQAYFAGLEIFEDVVIREDGVVECIGGDDDVLVYAFGAPETGVYCMTIFPLEKDPDSDTFDNSVGVEMAAYVANSLKKIG